MSTYGIKIFPSYYKSREIETYHSSLHGVNVKCLNVVSYQGNCNRFVSAEMTETRSAGLLCDANDEQQKTGPTFALQARKMTNSLRSNPSDPAED